MFLLIGTVVRCGLVHFSQDVPIIFLSKLMSSLNNEESLEQRHGMPSQNSAQMRFLCCVDGSGCGVRVRVYICGGSVFNSQFHWESDTEVFPHVSFFLKGLFWDT